MTDEVEAQTILRRAIDLIARTPGYGEVGRDLLLLMSRGRLVFVPGLEDRAQATVSGKLLVGPEALRSPPISLAQTLVHEHHHLRRQRPLEKTASFWIGVASRQHVMRRYERPAYLAGLAFLQAVASARPELAASARAEQSAVAASFAASYGGTLLG